MHCIASLCIDELSPTVLHYCTHISTTELRSLGLSPDFIVCRGRTAVSSAAREKISMFCNVPFDNVLSVHDVSNIYHVPMVSHVS